jgi:hypothetical protein
MSAGRLKVIDAKDGYQRLQDGEDAPGRCTTCSGGYCGAEEGVTIRMKLEYLEAGSPDCPLIRLYDFTSEEAARLHAALTSLAAGAVQRVLVHDLTGVKVIGNCRLVLVVGWRDQGIVPRAAPADFEYALTAATWDNVAGLVEPFGNGSTGFQWLPAESGDAGVLLSPDGRW